MPGFTLNAGQLALSAEELSSVAAGPRSLESVGITVRGGAFTENGREDSAIRIDLGSIYHGSLKEKIGLLRRAVAVRRRVKFRLVEEYGPGCFTVGEDGCIRNGAFPAVNRHSAGFFPSETACRLSGRSTLENSMYRQSGGCWNRIRKRQG